MKKGIALLIVAVLFAALLSITNFAADYDAEYDINGYLGTITISGGTINATDGSYAAGIGGGLDGSGVNINFSVGIIERD